MDNERIQDIRTRADAATKGPWHVEGFGVVRDEEWVICERTGKGTTEDAAFIANAREDIPWLLDQLTALQRDLYVYKNAEQAGLLVHLPSRADVIIGMVEKALNIELHDWQKAYITDSSRYTQPGRGTGKTLAYVIKLCLSDGEPIYLYQRGELENYIDERRDGHYKVFFEKMLREVYKQLSQQPQLKLRQIVFPYISACDDRYTRGRRGE